MWICMQTVSYDLIITNANLSLPEQNGCHFANIFKHIFMNEKFCILIQISLKFVPKGLIDNKSV